MDDRELHIQFTENAFRAEAERSRQAIHKRAYDGLIARMNKMAEELDRYDDFAMLKIDADKYRREGDSPYGIREVHSLHFGQGVILAHQRAAALAFLRELRGFGLLADVVGSGKTYEAGVVLSELAVRDRLHSLLLVVPAQVYDSWTDVLENKFGLGAGALIHVDASFDLDRVPCERAGGFLRPLRPLIVKTEDFVQWPEAVSQYLFDVIVVDEAHHLCAEEGRYAKAMKLLSLMMQTKKRAGATYCLLLSATPHSGNLAHMFRLWYFIRCKGGNPSDFDEKEDKDRSEEYNAEKEYYMQHVCRGAATVQEFIKKVKLNEVSLSHAAAFRQWLSSPRRLPGGETRALTEEEFSRMTEGERYSMVAEFLRDSPAIEREVVDRVASAYHDGVLRSIMIRQPQSHIVRQKSVVNHYFFPTRAPLGKLVTQGLAEEPVTVDCTRLRSDEAVSVNGKSMSVREYIADCRGNRSEARAYAEFIVSKVLSRLSAADPSYDEIFPKKGTIGYYWRQLALSPSGVRDEVIPVACDPDDKFSYKYACAAEIFRRHAGERVLVFFDYDVKKEDALADRFEQALLADPAFAARVLVGTAANKRAAERAFREKEDAILVVKDVSLTEGVNLQESSVIVNFQVTPDPLAMDQRIGRIFRLGQKHNVVIHSLADMNALEGYVLAYFSRIGLLSSRSGDATIIAGSNNERMVTVRCPACGNVKLYSQEDYELAKKRGVTGGLYCTATKLCTEKSRDGTQMQEISTTDFKCDDCGAVFRRSVTREGYLCMASNETESGVMCNSGRSGDRTFYCRKICAIAHCAYFRTPEMEGRCPALKRYLSQRNAGDAELMLECAACGNTACRAKCRVDTGVPAIESCGTCDYAACHPAPHAIRFDARWEADCPVCAAEGRRGRIRPVLARTFATYVRAAWDFRYDGGAGFCDNLADEAAKVDDIRKILESDEVRN